MNTSLSYESRWVRGVVAILGAVGVTSGLVLALRGVIALVDLRRGIEAELSPAYLAIAVAFFASTILIRVADPRLRSGREVGFRHGR